VAYVYPAYEVRMNGPDSPRMKSFEILKCLDIVDSGKVNLLVLVTHTAAASEWTFQHIGDSIQEACRSTFGTKFVDIVFFQDGGEQPNLIGKEEAEGGRRALVLEKISAMSGRQVGSISTESVFLTKYRRRNQPTASQLESARSFLTSIRLITSFRTQRLKFAHLGNGFNLATGETLSSPAGVYNGVEHSTEVRVGSKTVHLPSSVVLSPQQWQVEYTSYESKGNQYTFNFHMPLLRFDISDVDNYLSTSPGFREDFERRMFKGNESMADFVGKWGTHVIAREEWGGLIQVCLYLPFLCFSPSKQDLLAISSRLEVFLENALLNSSGPPMDLPRNAKLCYVKFDGEVYTSEPAIYRHMKDWIPRLVDKPFALPLNPLKRQQSLYPYYNHLPIDQQVLARRALEDYLKNATPNHRSLCSIV